MFPERKGFKDYVPGAFGWEDQKRLIEALGRALERGVLILGTNGFHEKLVEMYQEVFGENVALVERTSTVSGRKEGRGKYREIVFWANFEIPEEARPGVPLETSVKISLLILASPPSPKGEDLHQKEDHLERFAPREICFIVLGWLTWKRSFGWLAFLKGNDRPKSVWSRAAIRWA